jgi:hypothetical protein
MISHVSKKLLILILLTTLLIAFATRFNNWYWMPNHADAWGYYVYLPSIFIYNDLATLDTAAEIRRQYNPGSLGAVAGHPFGLIELHWTDKGRAGIKYTSGVALLQSPFFGIGHLAAKLLGFKADGFSKPYMLALLFSAVLYPLLGLFFLEKTLRKYFEKQTVWFVCIALILGTNLLYFATVNFMSHAYLFALYCLLIFTTDKWYADERKGLIPVAFMGFLSGLISMIRPNEVICIVIPLFWSVTSWNDLTPRFSLLIEHRKAILLAIFMGVLAWSPQLVYWHWVSGEWFHDSYPDEHFDFLNSRIWDGFFNYKNGWLVWTPLMFLALSGVFFLSKFARCAVLPIVIFMPVHIVVIYAWWAWWYPNGFGSRAMVETYPLLAFPLAAMIEQFQQNKRLKWIAFSAPLFFMGLNIFQTWQWGKGIFWTQEMNAAAYWTIFGKQRCTKEFLTALETKSMEPPFFVKFDSLLFYQDFENPVDSNFVHEKAQKGTWSYHFQTPYWQIAELKANDTQVRAGDWLRVSVQVWISPIEMVCDKSEAALLSVEFQGEQKHISSITLQNKVGQPKTWFHCGDVDIWDEVAFFVKIPPRVLHDSSIKIFFHKKAQVKQTLHIDEFRVERWR